MKKAKLTTGKKLLTFSTRFLPAAALLVIAAAPALAEAGGYDCEAQCIVIDSLEYQVHVLGSVSYAADLTRREAFSVLERLCARKAQAYGFSLPGVVVDQISFRAERDSEVIHESSGSSTSSDAFEQDSSGTYWMSRRGRRRVSSGSTHASSVRVYSEAYSSWSSYTSVRDERRLAVDLIPASPKASCEFDEEIEEGEAPYSGTLPVRG